MRSRANRRSPGTTRKRATSWSRRSEYGDVDWREPAPLYQLRLPGGETLWVLPNHLKSQGFSAFGDAEELRTRQSSGLRGIYDRLRGAGAQHVVICGDLNRGPDPQDPTQHPTLEALFRDGDLVDAYSLPAFDPGPRPGTFKTATVKNRFDYFLRSPTLAEKVTAGGVWRRGAWGGRSGPPTDYDVEHDRAVQPAFAGAVLSDVAAPQPVSTLGTEPAFDQIVVGGRGG